MRFTAWLHEHYKEKGPLRWLTFALEALAALTLALLMLLTCADVVDRIASQVGVAALKFGDLINNRSSDYIFDLDRFSEFEGKTGPYLQYAAVRVQSILRKAADQGLEPGRITEPAAESERNLVLQLLELPEVIDRAIELRAPNHIAEYSHLLAGEFNRFYDECHILSEEDPAQQASWLAVSAWTLRALELLLHLLGIEIPDRM
jgi:arginyl-tRNA synthetase